MKPFTQIPTYNEGAVVEIPMEDFIELQDFLKFFAQPFDIVQRAYYNAINTGVIGFKYTEEDGTEISEDEARNRIEAYNKIQEEKDHN